MTKVIPLLDIDYVDTSASERYGPGERGNSGLYGNCPMAIHRWEFHLVNGKVRRFETGWITNPSGRLDYYCELMPECYVVHCNEVDVFTPSLIRNIS